MWSAILVSMSMANAGQIHASLDGAAGLVIRGVEGDVEVVAGSGDALSVSGDGAPRLVRKGDVWVVTVKEGSLEVSVPASLAALTVHGQLGRLVVRDLPTRLAVVSGTGPVEIVGASSVRVANTVGDLSVDDVKDDLIVDQLTGTIDARGVGGDVIVDGVSGAVRVDDVVGNLAVTGAPGGVVHNDVQGLVSL
jgi:hypothetical protein